MWDDEFYSYPALVEPAYRAELERRYEEKWKEQEIQTAAPLLVKSEKPAVTLEPIEVKQQRLF